MALKRGRRDADERWVDELTKEFLAESQEGLDRMEQCLTELETRFGDGELVAEIFRVVHTIKGSTGFLGFGRLEALAHAGESLLGSLRAGRIAVSAELISGLLDLLDGLRAILRLIEATGVEGQRSTDDDYDLIAQMIALNVGDAAASPSASPAATAPVPAEAARQQAASGPAVEASEADRQMEAADRVERRLAIQSQEATLRVDVEVLNRMMNLVGELVLTRNRILQSGVESKDFPELARRLDRVTSDLRNAVMQARMQPVGHLFGKYPRMVRDLARVCGRQVALSFEGTGTELDKSLLEAVRDPLTHAVRNAVDHGIESPEERVRAGKKPEGTIQLRAYSQSGTVVIEVADDGAGISVERVLAKALERGLVTAEQASAMAPREAMELLFEPGFSTASAVTSVSGRGVGLDVVRSNVEKVGGTVELESWPGAGTALRLRMPLTLAIVPALIVRSGGSLFALPQRKIVELMYAPVGDVGSGFERMGGCELFRVRERLLPVVRLGEVLGMSAGNAVAKHGGYVAVVESDGRRYALILDELFSPQEIVVKPVSPVLLESGVFLGATALGGGELALVLDVAGIGARAGVRPERETISAVDAGGAAPERAGEQYVLYEIARRGSGGPAERHAMPLSAVERIERVPRSSIQSAGGREMLLHGRELLPVEDEGGLLRGGEREELTVLICNGPRRIGMVVDRVVDVCSIAGEAEDDPRTAAVRVVNERLTTLRAWADGSAAMPAFEEVA